MKKLLALIIALSVAFIFGIFWWNNGSSSTNPLDKNPKIFVVNKGDGVREIANRLKSQGLIKDPVIFFLIVKQLNLDKEIQAGDFRLNPSMTAQEVAESLTHGTLDIWITVPEGKRAMEIAEILKEKMVTYDASWPVTLSSEEGYLFPDTYLIPKDANITTIINQMRGNFEEKYTALNTPNTGLTKEQIVILASLIEREAITDEEKSIIAGILINRLNLGMALQVDATIQYAKGKDQSNGKWWEPVTLEEYKSVNSNYNTYQFLGFPPGPISNPGIEAIRSAAYPSNTDYFYYLHDGNGTIRYAKTLAEHNANIQKYGL